MSRARSVPRPVRDKPPSGERHPFVSHELTVMHESAHVRGRCRPWSVPVKRFAAPTSRGAKFWWNDLLGGAVPHDSVNLLGGITHLPLAYPSGKVRLAVNQYLVYERRGLDYLSPIPVDEIFDDPEAGERLFRLGEPQGMFEVNGMIVPGKKVDAVGKRDTLWLEYHVGTTNASNTVSDGNVQKGVYGRFVARWYNQSLGGFGFWTPNIVDEQMIRSANATGPNGNRIIADTAFQSERVSVGP